MRRLLFVSLVCVLAVGCAFGLSALGAPAARSAPYTQVVDNTTKGRFDAPGWKVSSYSETRYGKNYHYAKPDDQGKSARYKVDIPSDGQYTILARWPSNSGYNSAARYGIKTASGMQWKTVDQRKSGGRWMKLGVYKMERGDDFSVQVARETNGKGYVIADAVKVVRGDADGSSGGGSGGGGGGSGTTGTKVVKEAKTWLGVPYRYGGTSRSGVDCSGLTYSVYRKFGINLPRVAADQYNGGPGKKVAKSELKRGYLVFGHADGGRGIQHVGIITGDRRMIHAPQPGTVVRYDPLPVSWYNIVGVKRIVPA